MQELELSSSEADLAAAVERASAGEPSIITRHGRPTAVIIGYADYERLSQVPSFGDLLMSAPLEESDILPREPQAREEEVRLEALLLEGLASKRLPLDETFLNGLDAKAGAIIEKRKTRKRP